MLWNRTGRGDIKDIYRDVTVPIMEAFEAFDAAEFDKAVDIMRPLRYSVQRIGGSHAQVKYRGSKNCAMYY